MFKTILGEMALTMSMKYMEAIDDILRRKI